MLSGKVRAAHRFRHSRLQIELECAMLVVGVIGAVAVRQIAIGAIAICLAGKDRPCPDPITVRGEGPHKKHADVDRETMGEQESRYSGPCAGQWNTS